MTPGGRAKSVTITLAAAVAADARDAVRAVVDFFDWPPHSDMFPKVAGRVRTSFPILRALLDVALALARARRSPRRARSTSSSKRTARKIPR